MSILSIRKGGCPFNNFIRFQLSPAPAVHTMIVEQVQTAKRLLWNTWRGSQLLLFYLLVRSFTRGGKYELKFTLSLPHFFITVTPEHMTTTEIPLSGIELVSEVCNCFPPEPTAYKASCLFQTFSYIECIVYDSRGSMHMDTTACEVQTHWANTCKLGVCCQIGVHNTQTSAAA